MFRCSCSDVASVLAVRADAPFNNAKDSLNGARLIPEKSHGLIMA